MDGTQLFLGELNNYDPAVNFAIETGGDTIAFLDLRISLAEHGNNLKLNFAIHRKESFSGVSIHRDSLHHPTHKMAAINAAIQRLTNLPLIPEGIQREIQYIEKIAETNGIKADIKQLICRKRLRQTLATPEIPEINSRPTRKKWIRLPFLRRPPFRLAKELRHFNYHFGFYPSPP